MASTAAADDDTIVEGQAEGKITLRDDLGARLVVGAPLKRVVVFNRYNAEFLRAIAGPGVIVGAGADTLRDPAYWPNLHAALAGQGQSAPNYEAIVALRPDAVIVPRNGDWAKMRQLLGPFDIPVIVLTAWDVLKHEKNVALLGRVLDSDAEAEKLNAFYRNIRDLLAARTAGAPRRRVYFEEVADFKTVLKGSGWHDMIEAAGGINVFSPVDGGAPTRGNVQAFDVDPEDVLARRPELIIKLQPNQYAPHTRAFCADVLGRIAARPGFAALPAVTRGDVYSISYYLAGGCSKIVGALQIAKWLHPERFADVDPGAAMRTWLETFQGVPYPGDYWTALAQIRP